MSVTLKTMSFDARYFPINRDSFSQILLSFVAMQHSAPSKPHRMHVTYIPLHISRVADARHVHPHRISTHCLAVSTMCFVVFRLVARFDIDNFAENKLEAEIGLRRCTFMHIFDKYCGSSTVIDSHVKMYRLFAFMKQYPVCRSISSNLLTSSTTITKYILFLSSVINELQPVWNSRNEMINRLPHHFANNVVGSIDTFPIKVYRPSSSSNQSLLYNGKYKYHLYKVLHW
jgi:hypothetical protein